MQRDYEARLAEFEKDFLQKKREIDKDKKEIKQYLMDSFDDYENEYDYDSEDDGYYGDEDLYDYFANGSDEDANQDDLKRLEQNEYGNQK